MVFAQSKTLSVCQCRDTIWRTPAIWERRRSRGKRTLVTRGSRRRSRGKAKLCERVRLDKQIGHIIASVANICEQNKALSARVATLEQLHKVRQIVPTTALTPVGDLMQIFHMRISKRNLKLMRIVMRKQEIVWTLMLGCCRTRQGRTLMMGWPVRSTPDYSCQLIELELKRS